MFLQIHFTEAQGNFCLFVISGKLIILKQKKGLFFAPAPLFPSHIELKNRQKVFHIKLPDLPQTVSEGVRHAYQI